MAYFEQRIARDGSPRYRAQIRLKGRPAQNKTFRRLTDAKRWARKIEVTADEGRYLPTSEARRRTVGDLLDAYDAQHLRQRPKATRQKRLSHLDWWRKRVGTVALLQLDRLAIRECIEALKAGETLSGRVPANATVNRYRASLRHAFSWGVENGYLEYNILKGIRGEPEPRGRVRFLDESERDRLLAACRASPDRRFYPLVVLALATGARQGELLSLRWRDVDFHRRVAILHLTKNRERRALPLSPTAIAVLRERSAVRRIDCDLIFADDRGRTTFRQDTWRNILAEAEIVDFRFHDLRHTAASYLAMSGATLAEIAEVLGHKTLEMVKRYAHMTDAHTAKIVERMNRQFLGPRALAHGGLLGSTQDRVDSRSSARARRSSTPPGEDDDNA